MIHISPLPFTSRYFSTTTFYIYISIFSLIDDSFFLESLLSVLFVIFEIVLHSSLSIDA